MKIQKIIPILLVSVAAAVAGRIDISDSNGSYSIEIPTVRSRALSRIFKNIPHDSVPSAAQDLLDSLGYFNHSWDTVGYRKVRLKTGPRMWVNRLIIRGDTELTIDSFHVMEFPRLYDAGEIHLLADEAISYLGQNGHPFARLSISVDSVAENKRDIIFNIQADQKCVFGRPRFYGVSKTRESVLLADLTFRPGEPFDMSKVEECRQRLLSRSYIADVEIGAPQLLPASEQDSDSVAQAVIPIRIVDDAGMGVDGALAYQSSEGEKGKMTGQFNLSLMNLFRSGESGSIHYEGREKFQRFDVTVSKPNFFSFPLTVSAGFGMEIEDRNYGHMHGEIELMTQLPGMWQAGVAFNGTETRDSLHSWQVYGVDLVLERKPERYEARVFGHHLALRTGSALADKGDGSYNRWLVDFSIGFHLPFLRRHALVANLTTQAITSDQDDSLHNVERYRVGGNSSVRGYAENQFPFGTIAYGQLEYHVYFNQQGSVFAFVDGGAGYMDDIMSHSGKRTDLLGYGLGIRMPARIGTLSLAWARNYTDRKNFGRLHVRVQNGLGAR
ncbi:MAG: BamA/TamA family outer membrane protein [Chitinivibrionales bacterium]